MQETLNNPLLSEADRRVILVGRTGLDQELRRDPTTEIIRAADLFDAIGELADLSDQPQTPHTIILGRSDANSEPLASPAQIRQSLSRVNQDAIVLAVEGLADPAAADQTIPQSVSQEDLLQTINHAAKLALLKQQAQEKQAQEEHAQEDQTQMDQAETESARNGAHHPDSSQNEPTNPAEPEITTLRTPATAFARAFGPSAPAVPATEVVLDPSLPDVAPLPLPQDEPLVRAILHAKPLLPIALAHLESTLNTKLSLETPAPGATALIRQQGDPKQLIASEDAPLPQSTLERIAAWLNPWLRLEHQHAELRDAAFTDSLTGAWNRRYFDRFLSAAIKQARPARLPVTILLFDIDHFKSYNDQFGHPAGDTILIETVRLLQSAIRPTDRVCRIGGDEFAVIFYEPEGPRNKDSAPPESIYNIAKRFQSQICSHNFPKLEALDTTLTISGGLATFPWDGDTPTKLLHAADKLLFRSKQAGKDAITLGPGAEMVCRIENQ